MALVLNTADGYSIWYEPGQARVVSQANKLFILTSYLLGRLELKGLYTIGSKSEKENPSGSEFW